MRNKAHRLWREWTDARGGGGGAAAARRGDLVARRPPELGMLPSDIVIESANELRLARQRRDERAVSSTLHEIGTAHFGALNAVSGPCFQVGLARVAQQLGALCAELSLLGNEGGVATSVAGRSCDRYVHGAAARTGTPQAEAARAEEVRTEAAAVPAVEAAAEGGAVAAVAAAVAAVAAVAA
eukprot:6108197-Prymnesium_polylepis.1